MSKYNDKKFYWLQLKEDFFDEDSINWLEEQPNGKEYCLFYLKLCLKSLKTSGIMVRQVGEMLVPYDCKKLSEITNTDVDTVVVAMELLKKIGLIKVLDNGELYLTEVEKMIGSQSIGAFKKQQQRLAGGHSADICPPDIDIELELEKDIDIEKRIENNSSGGVKNDNVFDIEGPSSKSSCTNEGETAYSFNQPIQEQQTITVDSGKEIISFILKDNSIYSITESEYNEFSEAYPSIDIMQELRKLRAWCMSNPSKRKTRRGALKFVNNWLSNAQEKIKAYNNVSYDSAKNKIQTPNNNNGPQLVNCP